MAIYFNAPGGEDLADFIEEWSGERIGERIKRIRELREMTRADLGALVGLDQNRVQQYENGRRKPKIQLLKKFAAALGVETIALMDPNIDSCIYAMHTLFQMEKKLGLHVIKNDERLCLQFGDGVNGEMNSDLKEWYNAFKTMRESILDVTDEERRKKIFDYDMFELTYPGGIDKNARKKYYDHPINRMQELQEENEQLRNLLEKLEKQRKQDEE